ncbi:MAG: FAD-binding protein [Propionibacteriales bacterium]|nr:FAD-binding protein [Propionibacteriales bacterium]
MTDLTRRTLLRGAAAGIASALGPAALLGCTGSDGPAASGARTPRPSGAATPTGPTTRARPTVADWRALGSGLEGDVVLLDDAGYDAARRLYQPRFDVRRPAAVVRARSTADVREAVMFGRRHGVAVRPMAGGHSYVGASTADGAMVISVRPMSRVEYDPASQTVLLGAGGLLFDVHRTLEAHGRTVPTGSCPSVGAAGLTFGGGLGAEMRAYGLTCDNLRAATVVTADGEVREVSAERDADLWWALRGGGGGNLGVVTSMRMRTHPAGEVGFSFLTWRDADAEAMVLGWQGRVPAQPRSAWANLHLDASPDGSIRPIVVGLALDGDAEREADRLVATVGREPASRDVFTRSHHEATKLLAGCSELTDDQCRLQPDGALNRADTASGSDVLGGPMSGRTVRSLLRVIRARAESGGTAAAILDPLGGAVADVGVGGTAFAWRRALATVQWYVALSPSAPTSEVRDTYRWIAEGHRALRAASVGAYVNYLEPGRAVGSYYGPNYARLRRVKRRYDPDGMFRSGAPIAA